MTAVKQIGLVSVCEWRRVEGFYDLSQNLWTCPENLMFIGPCIIVIVEKWKTNLMSLAILFHFLCAQHVSDINISIIRSLRLCCWITTSVAFFSVRCVLEIWCGCFWVVLVLQAEAQLKTRRPNKLALWNKLHFEEKKKESIEHV